MDQGVDSSATGKLLSKPLSIVQGTIQKIMSIAPREQIQRLKDKLQRMEKEEPEEIKIKDCIRHLEDNEKIKLIDCLAISHILNDEKILIASKHVEENIDAYWDQLTQELGEDVKDKIEIK